MIAFRQLALQRGTQPLIEDADLTLHAGHKATVMADKQRLAADKDRIETERDASRQAAKDARRRLKFPQPRFNTAAASTAK